MPDESADELRRIGVRLEWIYSVDSGSDMTALIAPLFREPAVGVDDEDGPAGVSEP